MHLIDPHIRKLSRALFLFAWCLCLTEASVAQDEAAFRSIIAAHYERYPLMEVSDLYKLIHQACLGSEHAVTDAASAHSWLKEELASLREGPDDPMLDPLRPDSGIVRIHLRPYLASGGRADLLLEAFVRTANLHSGSAQVLRKVWSIAEQMASEGSLPFDAAEMRRFVDDMEASGFAAVHHSAAYREAYRPAYRVVALRYLPPDLRAQRCPAEK